MQFLFFPITTMFQTGINKKITFNKHFARKYIRAYTKSSDQFGLFYLHKSELSPFIPFHFVVRLTPVSDMADIIQLDLTQYKH